MFIMPVKISGIYNDSVGLVLSHVCLVNCYKVYGGTVTL